MNLEIFKNHLAQPIDIVHSSGVLIPLVKVADTWHLLFEVRAANLRRQPGEICFPGGGLDAAESARDAAIRETCEELGINDEQIEVIGPMDFLVTVFGDYLQPYVAILHQVDCAKLAFNRREVDSLFTVPLDFFINNPAERYAVRTEMVAPPDFPYQKIGRTNGYNWRCRDYDVLFYQYQDKVIWGMTAKLISRMVEYLKK